MCRGPPEDKSLVPYERGACGLAMAPDPAVENQVDALMSTRNAAATSRNARSCARNRREVVHRRSPVRRSIHGLDQAVEVRAHRLTGAADTTPWTAVDESDCRRLGCEGGMAADVHRR